MAEKKSSQFDHNIRRIIN